MWGLSTLLCFNPHLTPVNPHFKVADYSLMPTLRKDFPTF